MNASTKPAKVTVSATENAAGEREITRNGVLVGTCSLTIASWCGCRGRRERWWNVTSVTGHTFRTPTPLLSDVRALFA